MTPEERDRLARLETDHAAVREQVAEMQGRLAGITATLNRAFGGAAALIAAGGFLAWIWSWVEKLGKLGR